MGGRKRISIGGALLLGAALSACGGGGGGVNPNPAPPPPATTPPVTQPPAPTAPTPAPAPAPAPPTVNFDDAEYRRSSAAVAANALTAYNAGASGAGVKIAVLDSGLSDPNGQFAGRIDPASRDMAGARGITDVDGHGTSVTAVAAAGRDGGDILGVAYNATVLALRTDDPGSCASSDGCQSFGTVLAQGVDHARQNGARVINLSLGGSPTGAALSAAIGRATAAGIIVVIAAGNDGEEPEGANPDSFAQVASTANGNGLVLIAGAHDSAGQIAPFSNRAGSFGQFYLTALGSRVRAFDHTGAPFLFFGTSYATPAIAGAVALLAQAFPHLTGAQIVDLLFRTATDAGDPGVDSVYGRGILNLTGAFQPQGAMSLAGNGAAVSLGSNGTLGTAMGDAGAQGASSLGGAVFLDSYARAYSLNLGATIGAAAESRPLVRAIGGDVRRASLGAGSLAVSLTVSRQSFGQPWLGLAQRGLSRDDNRAARALAGMALMRIDGRTAAAFGIAEGGGALARLLAGEGSTPYLIARDPGDAPGFEARRGLSMAMHHDLGPVTVAVTAERGSLLEDRRHDATPGYNLATVGFERWQGALRLAAGIGVMREEASVLGSRFGAAFGGGGGATTRLLDLAIGWRPGGGWTVNGAWRQGWTRAVRGGAMAADGRLVSTAFAIDVGRARPNERFGLRIAQPLRVASGGFALSLPVRYDYATGAVGYADRRLNLAPRGREIDAEAVYGRRLGAGWLDANLYWRREPGNFAAAPDDLGAALRFTIGL